MLHINAPWNLVQTSEIKYLFSAKKYLSDNEVKTKTGAYEPMLNICYERFVITFSNESNHLKYSNYCCQL